MIKKLKRDFVITAVSIVSTVLLLVMSILIITTYRQQENRVYGDLRIAEKRLTEDNRVNTNRKFLPAKLKSRPVAVIEITTDKQIQNIYGDLEISKDEATNITSKISDGDNEGIIRSESVIYITKDYDDYAVIVLSDYTHEYKYLTQFAANLLIVMVLTIIIFVFISLFLAKRVISPVERAWQQQQQFISDASHELKTPLTIVLANTSIIKNKQDAPISESIKWIDNINDEALRMKSMVDDMLFLAKSDENKTDMCITENNISNIVMKKVLTFEPIAYERNISFTHNITNNIMAKCDLNQINQLIMILLDNAFKYCNVGGKVGIDLATSEHILTLSVHNTGNYIPSDDIEHIFDRFYMVDKARVRNNASHGLGLAIAHEIVTRHNGTITVNSNQEDCTRFDIKL